MARFVPRPLRLRPRAGRGIDELVWTDMLIMGVVNVTPDSFSDGGRFVGAAAAIAHGVALWRAGADILDIGGEATNPRAQPIDVATELARVVPVIEGLAAATRAVISIDTTKAAVARVAIAAGADLVNDVSGGRFDAEMFAAVDDTGAGYISGHLRGASLAQVFANEGSATWREVADEQWSQLDRMPAAVRQRTIVDPGLGFGKGADGRGNAALIAHAGDLAAALELPVLIGPSRKRFLQQLFTSSDHAAPVADNDAATVGAALAAARAGAHMVRVHDVSLLRPALAVYTNIERSRSLPVD